jgi:hypothetical protein
VTQQGELTHPVEVIAKVTEDTGSRSEPRLADSEAFRTGGGEPVIKDPRHPTELREGQNRPVSRGFGPSQYSLTS